MSKSDKLREIAAHCKSKVVRDDLKRFARAIDDGHWFEVRGEFEDICFRWIADKTDTGSTWRAAYDVMHPPYVEDVAPPVMPSDWSRLP